MDILLKDKNQPSYQIMWFLILIYSNDAGTRLYQSLGKKQVVRNKEYGPRLGLKSVSAIEKDEFCEQRGDGSFLPYKYLEKFKFNSKLSVSYLFSSQL